jgi:hypothetical protein
MDINHIELSPVLVAELYQSSLVDTDEEPLPVQPLAVTKQKDIPGPGWKWLGENKKNVLVIVQYAGSVYLPDEELSFLTGILGACKLSIGDTAIVNLVNHADVTYKELLAHFKSKIIFLFGVEPTAFGLPVSFPHFQVQAFANSTFLFAPTLKELEADKMLKSKLWVCLKRIFNI